MASIEDYKGGKKRVRWRDPDGRSRSKVCPNAKTAKELKRKADEAEALGIRLELREANRGPSLEDVMTAFLDHRARTRRPETARRAGQVMVKFARYVSRTVPRREPPPSVLSRSLLEGFFTWLTLRDTDASGNVVGTGLHGKARAVSTARKDVSI